MKVFILTNGEYSDYRVVGAFSSSAKAKAVKAELDGTAEILCMELNEDHPKCNGLTGFKVSMNKAGSNSVHKLPSPREVFTYPDGFRNAFYGEEEFSLGESVAYFHALAKDEQHAIKIAN